MTRITLIAFFSLLIMSCNGPKEAPEFKQITNIEVTKVMGRTAYLNADAYFYNPNKVRMTLKKINVDVMVEGKKIGEINQSVKTKIPAMSDFKIPLDATFDMGEVGFLNSIISILGGKKVKVHYTGHIKLTYHGFPIRVPIDYDDEVRI
ncbi:NDR1/HIN1-like protein [Fulvivirga sediminis]|uniref:LEA type 2 family protein n=1 Tax=Fulvivirga sediminis TaxID=2803949 RepID=A0A937K0S2_9BACT|nr:LEA type 2 family protein [Fulvivirga sediminis]MBL3657894.1 LEA type 2 family protein [Fulvivirga sediminis]